MPVVADIASRRRNWNSGALGASLSICRGREKSMRLRRGRGCGSVRGLRSVREGTVVMGRRIGWHGEVV